MEQRPIKGAKMLPPVLGKKPEPGRAAGPLLRRPGSFAAQHGEWRL
jgi:hypothetical protein